jgi:hypothetical protein
MFIFSKLLLWAIALQLVLGFIAYHLVAIALK